MIGPRVISPVLNPSLLDTAPQPETTARVGDPSVALTPSSRRTFMETWGHRLDVRQHPGMMEKPLAKSSYTQGGRGKPSSATSVTDWRDRRTCSRFCTFDVTNRKSKPN